MTPQRATPQPAPPIVLEPSGSAKACVIWLHGLGADGSDFVPIAPELGLPAELGVRFVFPHAPHIPVTINGGVVMPAWYDIANLELERQIDLEGLRRSGDMLAGLIKEQEALGIQPEQIAVAGFSQGGAVALHYGLRHPERLACILGLSTYLPPDPAWEQQRSPANQATPVFLAHGTQDPMVQMSKGEQTREVLSALAQPVEWRTYPMPHAVCAEEIHDIGLFLQLHLGGKAQ